VTQKLVGWYFGMLADIGGCPQSCGDDRAGNRSDPDDFVGMGLRRRYYPADGCFTAIRNFDNGVTIHFSGNEPGS